MAEVKCVICLIGAMDNLWFHQIILSSEPSLSLFPEVPKTNLPNSNSPAYSSKNSSQTSVVSEEEILLEESERMIDNAAQKDESNSQESDDDCDKEMRPTRLNLVSRKNNSSSHSSSPSAQKKESRKYEGYSGYSKRRLKKTMNCKSSWDLELEEVKGFMDLGFIFEKENLNKQMMSLIPGLQRIDAYKNEEKKLRNDSKSTNNDDNDYDIEGDEKTKGVVIRPYLSETWLIKLPDSPLLNLRIPRASTAVDMKKHLKYWARTVASAIQQES